MLAAMTLLACLYGLGCSSDDDPGTPDNTDTDVVVIDPDPDSLDAPWTLAGPSGYSDNGLGDRTLNGMTPGDYTVTWGIVGGWDAPTAETRTLPTGGRITFSGTYIEQAAPPAGFVRVDPGVFNMGSPPDEPGIAGNEDQHEVTLTRGFYIFATEVTNQQFRDMAQWAYDHGHVTATSSQLLDNLDGSTQELKSLGEYDREIAFSTGQFYCTHPDEPVKYVTWYGAAAYCDWLSLQQGLERAYNHTNWRCNSGSPTTAAGYRLPTEAEWEYACRAGSTTAFANGQITQLGCDVVDPVLNEIGWYCWHATGGTHSVGEKIANAYGLYDMHGNVREWCNDWLAAYGGAVTDPVGPATGSHRIHRGGDWHVSPQYCRSASRSNYAPDYSTQWLGFRPVRTAD